MKNGHKTSDHGQDRSSARRLSWRDLLAVVQGRPDEPASWDAPVAATVTAARQEPPIGPSEDLTQAVADKELAGVTPDGADGLLVRVPERLVPRWLRMVEDAGGAQEAMARLIAMAPPPSLPALRRTPRRSSELTTCHVTVLLTAEDAAAADQAAQAAGFRRAEWIRALVGAHLRRAPQWPPSQLRANSSARYQLQRIANLMRHCAGQLERPEAVDALLEAYRDARRQLTALRCAMTGALLYWDVDGE